MEPSITAVSKRQEKRKKKVKLKEEKRDICSPRKKYVLNIKWKHALPGLFWFAEIGIYKEERETVQFDTQNVQKWILSKKNLMRLVKICGCNFKLSS